MEEYKFNIHNIRLNEAHFSINNQYNWEKDKPIPLENNLGIKFKQSDELISVIVSVSSDSENQPFRFLVAYEGIFSFENMPQKDTLEQIAYINCASIIFPYVRETIADLTRRASLQPLNLPPFNFVANYKQNREKTSQKTKVRRQKGKKSST